MDSCSYDEDTNGNIFTFPSNANFSCSNLERRVQTLYQLARNWRVTYRQFSMCFLRTCSSFCFWNHKAQLFYKEVLNRQNFQGDHWYKLGLYLPLHPDNTKSMARKQIGYGMKVPLILLKDSKCDYFVASSCYQMGSSLSLGTIDYKVRLISIHNLNSYLIRSC